MAIVIPTPFIPRGKKLGEGFSRREIMDSHEHPGRKVDGSQSAAHWVCDLADNRKVVILCSFCRKNFSPRANKYRKLYIPDNTGRSDGYNVNGKCDGCKGQTALLGGGNLFLAEETWEACSMDPMEARRNARQAARMAAGAMKQWNAARDVKNNPNKYGYKHLKVKDTRRFK